MSRSLQSCLTLVGTVHRDPDGLSKSLGLLERLSCDLVLVELSPYGLAFRKKHGRKNQRTLFKNLRAAAKLCGIPFHEALEHSEISAIRLQMGLPFEYRAAVAYSRVHGADYRLVDSSAMSRRWIASWPELITEMNLAFLLTNPPHAPSVSSLYELAARRMRGDAGPSPVEERAMDPEQEALWEARERFLAKSVRSAITAFAPSKTVYLGGWIHLTAGAKVPSLREILGLGPAQCLILPHDLPDSNELKF